MAASGVSPKTPFIMLFLVIAGMSGLAATVGADGCTSCQNPFPLDAWFMGTPSVGTAPLTVYFMDTSTQSPDKWKWDFGDGTNSSEQNPAHTYAKPGKYRVTLEVSNGRQEDSAVRDGYVVVSDQARGTVVTGKTPTPARTPTRSATPVKTITPVSVPSGAEKPLNAEFTVTPVSGPAPLAVSFQDRSTGTITTRVFDFGDGTNATGTNPVHVYTQPGRYTITLFIAGPTGASAKQLINGIRVMEGSGAAVSTTTPTKKPTLTKTPTLTRTRVPVPTKAVFNQTTSLWQSNLSKGFLLKR